jgi:acyl dehydratase
MLPLEVGQRAALSKTVNDADVRAFAELSLDDNPVHLDEDYAKTTRFGGRIAHGMLAASLVSAVIGTRLPGYGTIYLSQSLAFKGPVRLGDTLTASAVIKAVRADKPIITLETLVHNQRGELVLSGEAVVLAPR